MYGGGPARPPPQQPPQETPGGAQSAKQAHPLDIKPLVATNRFKQSTYEVFQPLPIKAYYVASSGGGKSSAAIAASWRIEGLARTAFVVIVASLWRGPRALRRNAIVKRTLPLEKITLQCCRGCIVVLAKAARWG